MTVINASAAVTLLEQRPEKNIVSNIEDHIQSYFQHLKFCQIFSALSLKIVMTCLPFHL